MAMVMATALAGADGGNGRRWLRRWWREVKATVILLETLTADCPDGGDGGGQCGDAGSDDHDDDVDDDDGGDPPGVAGPVGRKHE